MHPADQVDLAYSKLRLRQTVEAMQERAAKEKAAPKRKRRCVVPRRSQSTKHSAPNRLGN